jgi:cell division septal protein FtsQ
MANRKNYIKSKIDKVRPKKLLVARKGFWFTIILIILFCLGIYFSLFFQGIQIKNVFISGNQQVLTEDINNFVLNKVRINIIKIGNWDLHSDSIVFANNDKIAKSILENFSAIKGVEIKKSLFSQNIFINLSERTVFAIFCPTAVVERSSCYFMDENGVVFESTDKISQNMIVVRHFLSDPQVFAGEQVIQQNIMNLITKVENDLQSNFQISLKDAFITSPFRLDVKTTENWKIYFDLNVNSDINSQVTKLNLLLGGQITPEDRKNLRYIDLRPRDRAIVCDNNVCGG